MRKGDFLCLILYPGSDIRMDWEKVVAIDGPSGSGKSTLARTLARDLNLLYVDTGAMFRAIGLMAHRMAIDLSQLDELVSFLNNLSFQYLGKEDAIILINGENLTEAIRKHEVSKLASQISRIPKVRNFLLDKQRALAWDRVIVMEGRDISTVVFPKAFCKIFLTALPEIRAKRRYRELKERGEKNITLQKILADVKQRDLLDQNRKIAPLIPAENSLILDSSEMTQKEVLQHLKDYARKCSQLKKIELS
jgi:cytidylate kinase